MTRHTQLTLLFHGAIILLASLLTGLPLGVAILDGWPPEAVRAWAVTHAALVSAGIMLIAIGAAGQYLLLSVRLSAIFAWTLLASTYALSGGLVLTALTGQRGLAPTGPALNVVLHLCNVAGVLGALVAGVLLLRGAHAALRADTAARAGAGSI